ncbi:MAG: WxcM-like domain-containing protein [Chloroflexi bacterium]|nr:WxcM-like domain-containing protein [Chloroflexota bacterium]
MSLADCHQIDFPKIQDPRGNLTFIESDRHIPFEIKRVYYLYDVPGGATRAGHAHKKLQQVLIALSGSFDVLLDDGKQKERVHLSHPFRGLYIYPLTWRMIDNFSSSSVCLSIVSDFYAEDDYIREYDEFLKTVVGVKK